MALTRDVQKWNNMVIEEAMESVSIQEQLTKLMEIMENSNLKMEMTTKALNETKRILQGSIEELYAKNDHLKKWMGMTREQ